ncbi:MAG: DUF4386 family protein [Hyphomicrobiales bacterium]|nr:DUF4386 family protein [Hyphomicrobiales bacterium]
MTFHRLTGAALIAFAIFMNVPFTILSLTFDYPDVLRYPTADILARFSAGGAALIFTWWLYCFAAILLVPLALMLRAALDETGGQTYAAATTFAVIAGLTQAMGLARWVFAVPGLAAIAADPAATPAAKEAASVVFGALHQYAGVAIGEHIGQIFTALWAVTLGGAQFQAGRSMTGGLGMGAGLVIAGGLAEAFATVIPFDPGVLAILTPIGFLLLSLWIAAMGLQLSLELRH